MSSDETFPREESSLGTDSAAPDSDVDIATGDDFERFLSRLREIATNWRYSDEFIGLYVRSRWPADYSHQEAKS